jgi:CRP-like cAMP-binding protein
MDKTRVILINLFKNGKPLQYERGDTIIRAGDTPSGIYLITDGWVKVYSLCDDGESNILISLGKDDILPLEWVVTGHLRDVTFAALETTRLLRVPSKQFTDALTNDGLIARAAAGMLGDYCSRLSDELEYLPYHSARERVAFRLLTLAQCFGQAEGKAVIIQIRVPNEYIARSTNMTRETASREISRLAQKGFIQNSNGNIIIKNPTALQNEVGKTFSAQLSLSQQV